MSGDWLEKEIKKSKSKPPEIIIKVSRLAGCDVFASRTFPIEKGRVHVVQPY